ncbi:hypothetical protein [Anabaena azotica]|uniref:Uncharacterized protein n=1 Tax=Anabaena azotica FACHB-119 TaxID=947527 RepID=A0ABR8D4A3_9NOST|nr:hypothetical protein [Anabaena azotica]MBD2500991.1 hypothetical protein [Anabaena azotica FACHB-119]
MTINILDKKYADEARHKTLTDIENTIKMLNRYAGFSPKTKEEQNKFDEYVKIAHGKGKSIKELQQDLIIAKNNFSKALQLLLESLEDSNSIQKSIDALNLMAESTLKCWDFYSSDTRKFLKDFALKAIEFNKSINIEEWKGIEELVSENKKAIQRFINSVMGAMDWKNCETELGRSLLKIREDIILSGEPLMNLDEFNKYIEEEPV